MQEKASREDNNYIPNVPDENRASGFLPMEICKLIEAQKEVKKILSNPNLSYDNANLIYFFSKKECRSELFLEINEKVVPNKSVGGKFS